MKKNLLVACILCLLIIPTFSRGQDQYPELINVSPQSPDAAILGKFGNIPVGYSTGTPNISIPIYEIKIGKIDLPVSLDYHAGGIRVDDIASSVGIGWALNAGGIISRQLKGFPDENGGYLTAPSETAIFKDPGHYYQYLYGANADYEPDIFSYSIQGGSGKFEFNKDGSVFQIPVSDNRIQYIPSTQSTPTSFTITDPNGVVYVFDQPEVITMTTAVLTYTSAWRLSKIIDQTTRDTVFLTYDTGAGSELDHDDIATFINTPNNTEGGYGFSTTNTMLSTTASGISHSTEFFLNAITWRGGKILFQNATDRIDRVGEKRLSEADLYSNVNGVLQPLKSVKLFQSYFFYNSTKNLEYPYTDSDPRNYRLRLDSVVTYGANGIGQPQSYRMTYDPSLMTSRESTGQDNWGFNNGQFNNASLLPVEEVQDYLGSVYTVGSANRSPDSVFMKACSLQSIQYPTGGSSVFEMEPHKYSDPLTLENSNFYCGVITGSGPSSLTSTLTLPVNYLNLNYTINFSTFNYTTLIPQPSITITDQTTGIQTVFYSPNHLQFYNSGPIYNNYYSYNSINFVGGHTYTITANVSTNTTPIPNGVVLASIAINWQDYNNSPLYKIGGGLRVKSITNYDANGNFINKDLYKYGLSNEEGYGMLITYSSLLAINSSVQRLRLIENAFGDAVYNDAPQSYTYHSNTLANISEISGSPILYPQVVKYQVNSAGGQANGKTIYTYGIVQDNVAGVTSFGPFTIANDWENNILYNELILKSADGGTSYMPVSNKNYTYEIGRYGYKTQLKIVKNYSPIATEYQDSTNVATEVASNRYTLPDFSFVEYQNPTGIMRVQNITTTDYMDSGPNKVTVENYFYDDTTHLYPTRIQTFSSKNDTLTTINKYPKDFAATGNVYATMVNRNIKTPVIQQQQMKNSVQESLVKSDYSDWYGDGTILVPNAMEQQVGSYPIETRINFNKYDKYGNIIQQQKTNGAYQSYIWDYDKLFPTAIVNNADSVSIAYTSFESDGTGNWTIGSTARSASGFSGNQSYPLSSTNTLSKSGLTSSKTYIISYWTTNTAPITIAGTITGYPIKGPTLNGWTYYEHQVTGKTTITLSGTGNIDEVRLYPNSAQMTTYTYNPQIGISSTVNAKNQISYYEYDSFQRLINIKDEYGNIIKHMAYHYQGQ